MLSILKITQQVLEKQGYSKEQQQKELSNTYNKCIQNRSK